MRRRKLNRRQREWLTETLGKAAAGVFVAGFVVVHEAGGATTRWYHDGVGYHRVGALAGANPRPGRLR